MKRILGVGIMFLVVLVVTLAGCGDTKVEPDYTAEEFEAALNEGENLEGKIVSVKVNKFVPDSAFGYNIQAGEHLNFISSDNPDVKAGDEIIVEVESVKSALGSYMVSYKKK
ncbi:hypothetical protein [Lentibacillus sp. Marseille-P4043]|uniref:hypothetical protein n=1 Tax=Lentibacillus sp. Marseille-P4043 TaxID=2040293 RepID=UPI000D0B7AA1|nr:hypothetical protein [Lentibacillus sp. Marseille-P4043]